MNAPKKVASDVLRWTLILQSPGGSELFHDSLLFLGKFLRRLDANFDDEVTVLISFLDSLPAYSESFSRRRARRNSNYNFLAIESIHADFRSKRRLHYVQLKSSDHIEPFTLIELVGENIERDEQIAWRSIRRSFSARSLQQYLRAAVDTWRNG